MRTVTWGCLPSPPNDASPTSSPTNRPCSKSDSVVTSDLLHGKLFHRAKKREKEERRRRHPRGECRAARGGEPRLERRPDRVRLVWLGARSGPHEWPQGPPSTHERRHHQ